MKIYLLMAHPSGESLNNYIADMLQQKLMATGHEVRRENISDIQFDPILRKGYAHMQELEPELSISWENIKWCERWIIIYPVWWGAAPALLKGFIDRVLLPGHAFRYHDKGPFWDKLLTHKSAHIITTSDAPAFWLWWMYGNSDIRSLKHATLKFCGFHPIKVSRIDRVKYMTTGSLARNIKRLLGEYE